MDSPATTDDLWDGLQPNAVPLLTAITTWVAATYAAVITGDFGGVDTALETMHTEQHRYMAAAIPASSGAATELDYYREADHG